MTQSLLYIACYLVGLSLALAIGMGRRSLVAAAIAFPVGLGVIVLELYVWLYLGLPYTRLAVILLAAVPVTICAAILARRRSLGADLKALAIASAVFLVVAVLAGRFNQAYFSYDSHQLLFLGKRIGVAGGMQWSGYGSWGSFLPISHSLMVPLKVHFLFGLSPMFSLSTLFMLGAMLHAIVCEDGLLRRQLFLIVLMVVCLGLTWTYAIHTVYIHTNMPSAMFLLGFVGLFWLAEIDRSAGATALAFVMLLCFSLLRLETPLVACIFLTLTVYNSELPRRVKIPPTLVYGVLLVGWLLLLSRQLPEVSGFLTKRQGKILALLTGASVGFATIADLRYVRWLTRLIPVAAVVIAGAGVVLSLILKPIHMSESGMAMYENMMVRYYWGGVWWLMPVAAILAGLTPKRIRIPPSVSYGPWLFIALVFLLGFARAPYRLGPTDSASRIVLHILPVLFLYWGARFIPLAKGALLDRSAPEST